MIVSVVKVEYSKTVSKNYNSQKIAIGVECALEEGEDFGNVMTNMFLYCKTKAHSFEQEIQEIAPKLPEERPTKLHSLGFKDYEPPEPKGVKNDLPNKFTGVVIMEMSDKAIRIELNGQNTWLPKKSIVHGFEAHKNPQNIEIFDWMKEKIKWRDN